MKNKKVPTKDRNYWFCCDFETLTMNTKEFAKTQDFRVILSNSRNWNSNENFTFTNIASWWNYHLNLNNSQVIFFHNLTFDGEFILRFLSNHLNYVDLTKEDWNKQNNTYSVFRRGSKIYKIQIRIRTKNKIFTILIKCSYMLLSSSIKSLGESLNIMKYEQGQEQEEFYDVEPKFRVGDYDTKFVEYCLRDTEIMHKALMIFEDNVNNFKVVKSYNEWRIKHKRDIFNPLEYLTVSSLCRELQKRYVRKFAKFNGENNYLTSTFQESKFLRQWFLGGMTQTNPKFINKPRKINNTMFIDVTSAYPYQMTKYLPYGRIYQNKPSGDFVTLLEIEVKKAEIKWENRNCIFLKKWLFEKNKYNNRYVKSMKNFKCFYFQEEWEALQRYYDFKGVKIKYYYMKSKPFLKELNLEIFAMKEKYANEGKEALKLSSKILLNSGYGSLCRQDKYDSYLYFQKNTIGNLNKNDNVCLANKVWKVKQNTQYFNFNPEKLDLYVMEQMNGPEQSVNIAAAAYVTSLQRAYLMNTIAKVGKKNFIMCDTDSILFYKLNDEQKAYINRTILKDGLGNWTREDKKEINYFGSYGAKRYIVKSKDKVVKFRFAGVSMNVSKLKEKAEMLDFGEGKIHVENAIYEKIYTKSGVGLKKKDKVISKGKY